MAVGIRISQDGGGVQFGRQRNVLGQGMLWRSVGFLSVTLQRQKFQALAGCTPTLEHQVRQGWLGRPLSEVPEFWWAAAEAAVLWLGDEFG